MSDLLVRRTLEPLAGTGGDERLARAELRRQIGTLELRLSKLAAEAFPRLPIDTAVEAVSRAPRALDLGDLERVRDSLAARISGAEKEIAARSELETRNREALELMLAQPDQHRWVQISRADVGEPGCGGWHARPRFGLLGMLMGWWRVKISSGCPL